MYLIDGCVITANLRHTWSSRTTRSFRRIYDPINTQGTVFMLIQSLSGSVLDRRAHCFWHCIYNLTFTWVNTFRFILYSVTGCIGHLNFTLVSTWRFRLCYTLMLPINISWKVSCYLTHTQFFPWRFRTYDPRKISAISLLFELVVTDLRTVVLSNVEFVLAGLGPIILNIFAISLLLELVLSGGGPLFFSLYQWSLEVHHAPPPFQTPDMVITCKFSSNLHVSINLALNFRL